MTKSAKALHPVKAGGKVIKPGGDIAEATVGATRLERLVAKGRAAFPGEEAPVNRAETQTGKPPLALGDAKGKGGK